jgi:7,8-dihydropterin-6-yl-methyl-4-(beta-D-ribofuranosyl)aminobenzene 5'-phosphate synthase
MPAHGLTVQVFLDFLLFLSAGWSMELTVLVDNNTLLDCYLLAEPGLSLHLRDGDSQVLFDCGYSDVLRRNAASLGLDLAGLDHVVLSHGHNDHTWGLVPLLACLAERAAADGRPRRPTLTAHPQALAPRRLAHGEPIGSLLGADALAQCFDLVLSREPVPVTDRLLFLGQIPRLFPFENAAPIGERLEPDGPVPDDLPDDSALAYLGDDGLVVITGCSHAGICNIVEHARRTTGVRRVAAVFGGLHLRGPDPARFEATADYFRRIGLAALYAGHCTSLAAKIALSRTLPVHEVGTGLRLTFA